MLCHVGGLAAYENGCFHMHKLQEHGWWLFQNGTYFKTKNPMLPRHYMHTLTTSSCFAMGWYWFYPYHNKTKQNTAMCILQDHDDVIKWKHFPRYWPFVRGIHRSPVNSPHKGQWRRALMFSLIYVWIKGWVHNREAGDLRCYRTHYDVTVMIF